MVYGVALTAIALWPTPVDRDAGPLLRAITDAVPWLTYGVIEFSSNVVLFVPLGVLLTLLLPRGSLFVPLLALLVTAAIESVQGLLLAARTPSPLDILANTAGAVLGWAIVLAAQRVRRR